MSKMRPSQRVAEIAQKNYEEDCKENPDVLQSMARQIGYAIRSDNDIEKRKMALELVVENFVMLGIKDDGKLAIWLE